MRLIIEIEFGTDAMQRYSQARAVIADAVGTSDHRAKPEIGQGGSFRTANGDRVGKWEVIAEPYIYDAAARARDNDRATPEPPATTPKCPRCGGENITIQVDAWANYSLKGWDNAGEVVADFDEPASVDTFDDRHYTCIDCGHEDTWRDGRGFDPASDKYESPHPDTDEHRAGCPACMMAHDKAQPDR